MKKQAYMITNVGAFPRAPMVERLMNHFLSGTILETTHRLNPNAQDHNGTRLSPLGYTNIEVYLDELMRQRLIESCHT